MATASDITVYEYPNEVIVEIIGNDEFGEIAAITYQFSYVDGGEGQLAANQGIDDPHLELTRDALAERGYQLTADNRD